VSAKSMKNLKERDSAKYVTVKSCKQPCSTESFARKHVKSIENDAL